VDGAAHGIHPTVRPSSFYIVMAIGGVKLPAVTPPRSDWLCSALSITDFACISAARRLIFVWPTFRRLLMTRDQRQQVWTSMARTTL
jgi:hypothetical protein